MYLYFGLNCPVNVYKEEERLHKDKSAKCCFGTLTADLRRKLMIVNVTIRTERNKRMKCEIKTNQSII